MKLINALQKTFLWVGIFLLIVLPISSLFFKTAAPLRNALYQLSFIAVFLVMIIRPLSDIFIEYPGIRRLVILRKGFGVFSASIIIGFMLQKILAPESTYFSTLFSSQFFSFGNYAFFAYIGDISGAILLLTSNRLSQRILGVNWKRVQKLSYAYFYSGGIYEAFFLGVPFALYALLAVTNVTALAWGVKKLRKQELSQTPQSVPSSPGMSME